MQLDLNQAYDFYVKNIHKSCNQEILPKHIFGDMFEKWITSLMSQKMMMPDIEEVPIVTNCGNVKFLVINQIFKKIQSHEGF